MKQIIKLLAVACIIAALSGVLMYVLFWFGFELQSCVISALCFVLVASEIVVDNEYIYKKNKKHENNPRVFEL